MENLHLKYGVPLTCPPPPPPPLEAWEQHLLLLFLVVVVAVIIYGLSSQQVGTETANSEKKTFVGKFDNHLAITPSVTFENLAR